MSIQRIWLSPLELGERIDRPEAICRAPLESLPEQHLAEEREDGRFMLTMAAWEEWMPRLADLRAAA